MRKLLILICLCAGVARSQTTPSSLLITRIFNITNTWPGECAAGVIDNRSMFTRQNNYHSFFATGTGTWSVTMEFSDVSCAGPFTSYGPQAVVNQSSGLAIGYGVDGIAFHQFVTFVFSGANANTVQLTYSAVQNFFLSTTAGSLTFPIVVSQGGTGFSSCTANGFIYGNGTSALQCLAAGSQYQVAQAGSGGVPTIGPLQLAQSAAITGNLPSTNGGTGAASPAAHTVAVAEGSSAFNFAGPGTSGQPLVSGGASADPTYQTLPISGGGTGQVTQSAALTALLGSSIVPVPNGGTGVATATAHGVALGETTSPFNFTSAGTSGQPLVSNGASADPTYQTLPVSGGGTGLTTVTTNGIPYGNGASPLNVTAAGSQFQTLQAGSGGTPAFGAVALNQSAAVSGLLPAANGGTGAASPTAHTVAIAEGSSPFTFAGPGTSGQPFVSNGASVDPTYQTLSVAGGGTGITTATAHGVLVGQITSPFTVTAAGTSGQPLVSGGASADPTYQTLTVPGGGTGVTTATAHGVLLGEGTSAIGVTAIGTSGQPLVSNGAADPTYQTLPVSGGGTGVTTATAHGVVLGEGTSPVNVTAAGTSGQPLVSNGASADPTYQTLPVSGGGTGVTAAQGTGDTKVELAGSNSGTLGAALCNDANGGATTSGCATALPAGLQTQYLQIKSNTGNNTTTQFNNLPMISSVDYNFPAQTPGGSLSIGANTVTLTPCPLGVNGTDANHLLYISGGTGTVESVPITAGSCTSGLSTGTITFTAANTHTGAWTVQSATSGIQEAIVIASATNVAVYIPGGFWPVHGAITALNCPTLFGDGFGNNSRATLVLDNAINGIVYGGTSNVSTCDAAIFNLSTVTAGGSFSNAGVAVTFQHIIGGLIHNISVTGGFEGIRYLDVRGATLVDNVYAQADSIGQHITCLGVALPNCANEMGMTNVNVVLGVGASAGLQIEPTTTGVTINNLQVACGNNGSFGLLMIMNSTGPLNEIQVTNGFLDGCTSRAIFVQKGTGAVANNALQISNLKMSSSTTANNPVADFQAPLTNMMFYGNTLLQTNTSGTNNQGMEFEGVTNSVISNNTIGVSQNTAYPILFGAGPASEANSGLTFVGNQLGLIGTTPNHSVGNTSGDTTDTNLRFSANTLTGDVVAFPTGTSNIIFDSSNQNLPITVVASAATLPIPVTPIFTVSGNTNSTAVSNCPSGKVGKFVTTAAGITFTAGASIGNTFTTTQNVPVDFYCDSTKLWGHP